MIARNESNSVNQNTAALNKSFTEQKFEERLRELTNRIDIQEKEIAMLRIKDWPKIYDVGTDNLRLASQKDIDLLFIINQAYERLSEFMKNLRLDINAAKERYEK